MADDRRFVARLVAADRALASEQLSPRAVHRIGAHLARELDRQARARRFGWIPMLTFVAGAAAVLLVLVWRAAPKAPEPTVSTPAALASVSGRDCHQRAQPGEVELAGACEIAVREPAMRIATIASSRVGVAGNVVHVREGSALFDVARVRGEPVRVVVPGGAIVVIGTRFRVEVAGGAGRVELFEGRIEFHAQDGSVVPIEAGEQLEFGTRAPAADAIADDGVRVEQGDADEEPTILEDPPELLPLPVAEPARARSRPDVTSPGDLPTRSSAEIIDEVQALRRRGDYQGAAQQLRDALAQRWPSRTAEVLSYELGTILARHLQDQAAGCRHWREHRRRFDDARHREAIAASLASLGCE